MILLLSFYFVFTLQYAFITWSNDELDLILITDERIIIITEVDFLHMNYLYTTFKTYKEKLKVLCKPYYDMVPSKFQLPKTFIKDDIHRVLNSTNSDSDKHDSHKHLENLRNNIVKTLFFLLVMFLFCLIKIKKNVLKIKIKKIGKYSATL